VREKVMEEWVMYNVRVSRELDKIIELVRRAYGQATKSAALRLLLVEGWRAVKDEVIATLGEGAVRELEKGED